MPNFIYVECPCGRTLRARHEQMGTTVRCWNCGTHVVVPRHGEGGRLARAFAQGIRDALSPPSLAAAFGGAVLATVLLRVPTVGAWLFGALVAAGAWVLQGLIREGGLAFSGEVGGWRAAARWRELAIRLPLSLLGAAAVMAPTLIRNGGRSLPGGDPPLGGSWALPLAYAAWWLVGPLLFTLANARDRKGAIPPRRVFATFRARPRGTLVALLIAPLGLLAVELTLALVAAEQAHFPLLLNNVFPMPATTHTYHGVHLVYRYDGRVWDVPFEGTGVELVPVYLSGLRRGFTLLGGIPSSLTTRTVPFDPTIYQTTLTPFLALRLVLSIVALAAAAIVLGAQARCLGRLVAAGVEADIAASARTGLMVIPSLAAATGESAQSASSRTGLIPMPSLAEDEGPDPMASTRSGLIPVLPPPPADAIAAASARTALIPIPPQWAPPPAPAPAPPQPRGPTRPNVLIIDDEAEFAKALGTILTAHGFTVSIASNGRDGLVQAATVKPALIILDLLLPDRSGLDVCRALRMQPMTRSVPIVMLSARDGAVDEVTALEQGVDDYVAKPYVVDVLLARIRKQLHIARNGATPPRARDAATNQARAEVPANPSEAPADTDPGTHPE